MQILRSESKNAKDSLFGKEGHLFAKEGRLFAKQGHLFAEEDANLQQMEHHLHMCTSPNTQIGAVNIGFYKTYPRINL